MSLSEQEPSLLQTKAYNYVKNKIFANEFQPDVMYSESKLAKEIGISRTPLRQSLHRLSQDGYIVIYPSRGFMLRSLTPKDMKETIEVRCAIEGFCTYRLAEEMNGAKKAHVIAQLEEEVEAMRDTSLNDEDFIKHDHAFHLILVKSAENDLFNQNFHRLMYLIHLTSTSSLHVPGRRESTLKEHELYLDYLKKNSIEEAYQLMIKHLMMPLQIIKQ